MENEKSCHCYSCSEEINEFDTLECRECGELFCDNCFDEARNMCLDCCDFEISGDTE